MGISLISGKVHLTGYQIDDEDDLDETEMDDTTFDEESSDEEGNIGVGLGGWTCGSVSLTLQMSSCCGLYFKVQ